MVYYMPTFIDARDLVEIEKALLEGEDEFSYASCDGCDPDVYYKLVELFSEHKELYGTKIKEKSINKRLKKLMKELLYRNEYDDD